MNIISFFYSILSFLTGMLCFVDLYYFASWEMLFPFIFSALSSYLKTSLLLLKAMGDLFFQNANCFTSPRLYLCLCKILENTKSYKR